MKTFKTFLTEGLPTIQYGLRQGEVEDQYRKPIPDKTVKNVVDRERTREREEHRRGERDAYPEIKSELEPSPQQPRPQPEPQPIPSPAPVPPPKPSYSLQQSTRPKKVKPLPPKPSGWLDIFKFR